MKKKILLISTLAVFSMLIISFASAISTNTTNVERKESPLYRIRTINSVGVKLGDILHQIKTKFLGEKIFFLPTKWIASNSAQKDGPTDKGSISCDKACTVPGYHRSCWHITDCWSFCQPSCE